VEIAVKRTSVASIVAGGIVALFMLPQPSFSRGAVAQDPWNPAHLAMLPPEVRAGVLKWNAACGGPIAAAQRFALYLTVPSARFVALDFDDFQCRNKAVHCDTAGCLHEVYVSWGGRYQRVLAVRAYDVRLSSSHDQAFLEIQNTNGNSRRLRWNGSRFVE
jgi:hypothetical protein